MIKQKSGRIINIGSFVALQGGIIRYSSPYVASKAGVIALTKAMALELAPYGINVNSISPGTTLTHMTEALYSDPNLKEEILKYVPFKRPAMPEDIANAALFLASDMASYITGINLIVDGGWTAGTPYTLPRQYKPK
jgi:NAD(P)-dependent dehydrogenase (short-subunit alcohol dehydrogenase family)